MMKSVKKNAENNIDFKELWLYTKHVGLYEKFGWKYFYDFDTYNKEDRIQRLYRLQLKR